MNEAIDKEVKFNKNLHKPLDKEIKIAVNPVYGDAIEHEEVLDKHIEDMKDTLDAKAKAIETESPKANAKMPKTIYTQTNKIDLDESLFDDNEPIKESYGDMASAVTKDGKKVMAVADTSHTRTYNYEHVTFRFDNREGKGKYRWQNRPWQRFSFASALQNAMVECGVDEKFAEEVIEKSHDLETAIDYFADNYGTKDESLNEKNYTEYDGWDEKDVELHKSIDWAERNYKDYPVEEDTFTSRAFHYPANDEGDMKEVKFIKYLRANPIFPPYYAPAEKPFDNAAGPMFDGRTHGNYDIHDRYETWELYDRLSEDRLSTKGRDDFEKKVDKLPDDVWTLVNDSLNPPSSNYRTLIARDVKRAYNPDDFVFDDTNIGVYLGNESEADRVKAVADELKLKCTIKKNLGNAEKPFVATIIIPEDIAEKSAKAYLASIGHNLVVRKTNPNRKATNESVNTLTEDAKIIMDIYEYEPWSGAVETFQKIKDADKVDELDAIIEDTYPEGLTVTELNDILWFDSDWVFEMLGMTEEEDEE